jgi:hypothetical protein
MQAATLGKHEVEDLDHSNVDDGSGGAGVCAIFLHGAGRENEEVHHHAPITSEVTVVNGDTAYKTKAEAESGMKTIKVWTSN